MKKPIVEFGRAPVTTKVFATPAVPGTGFASVNVGGGALVTTISAGLLSVFVPPGPVTVRLTANVPAA